MDRRRIALASVLTAAVIALLFGVAVPAVQAASFTYANEISTPSGHERTSGARSNVTGGTSDVALGIGEHSITTYYDYPGYTTLYTVKGTGGSLANMTHPAKSNAHSKCSFSVSVGGSADLTCTVKG